ncbi:MAG: 7-carboxy-7-deazaguanine synthase QueE [Gammaproteobacteria bacterium]|nr:7-carboxy-7-deazaguanine synthase QueE [Gammaproteobacteria bacterium]
MAVSGNAQGSSDTRLRISEIFFSLQGESRTVGLPTVFVRLTGCPLRCGYCDTSYAFQGGEWMSLETILQSVATYKAKHVCVTGGEPLAQRDCLPLLQALCDMGYEVSLETSGALDIAKVDPRVSRVMDLKTPASGEQTKNRLENIEFLGVGDQLKLVICDRADYEWAVDMVGKYQLAERCEVLFSPCVGQLEARQLADWILQDNLPVRFQLQLHKLIWGDEPGR